MKGFFETCPTLDALPDSVLFQPSPVGVFLNGCFDTIDYKRESALAPGKAPAPRGTAAPTWKRWAPTNHARTGAALFLYAFPYRPFPAKLLFHHLDVDVEITLFNRWTDLLVLVLPTLSTEGQARQTHAPACTSTRCLLAMPVNLFHLDLGGWNSLR